jgi:hypothetical protein
MAILNSDGSVYQPTGSLTQFDPDSVEHDLFNSFDQEVIEIGGSPLFYHEVFISMNTIDELYAEDRGKIWSNCPICIYGYYEPVPAQNFMSTFGIDSPDEMMFEFNYQHVLKNIGHPPKIGSRIYSPHKRENWVIIQRNLEVYKLWGEIRLQLMCQRFQESLSTGEGKISQPSVSFKINDIKDLS